jgi:hypothetical protein
MKDEIIKKSYKSAFDIDDKSLKDLIIINTKCLIDDITQRYVFIDNNRLREELVYYKYYSEKPTYNNIFSILIPIILSNTNIQKSEEEVVSLIQKYVKFLKKDAYLSEFLIASVIYNAILHNILEDKNIKYDELLQKIKERIIGFSINLDKINTIKFQMARINTIKYIDDYIDNKIEDYDEEKIILSMLNVLYDIYIENRNVENQGILSIKKSILSILGEESLNIDNIDFVSSMSEYILKLRKYKVNKTLYNQSVDVRQIVKLNEGDTTIDPILNKIVVISKTFSDNILQIKVKSKSGDYVFKFKKAN